MAKKRESGIPMGLGGAIRLLPMLWKYGQLSYSLLRDPRIPLGLKIGLVTGAVVVLSPLDLFPTAIPIIGEISDFFFLLLVIQIFLRLVPREIVEEHIEKLGLEGQVRVLLRRR